MALASAGANATGAAPVKTRADRKADKNLREVADKAVAVADSVADEADTEL